MSQNAPYVLDMKAGIYTWCACGLSKNQPFCDGSHSATPFRPITAHITEDKKIAWCGCKASNKKPYCDGTHAKIKS
ncbi:MAG: CDGSH iron-sulfur domain-containing protein [Candidatus Omnitrophica bacterium]|nr:CDGSH iron-sulfur domain-containing protein [Candidatus Omnitrophota bacterium]